MSELDHDAHAYARINAATIMQGIASEGQKPLAEAINVDQSTSGQTIVCLSA